MVLLATTAFVSALLGFLVQPILGQYILPWYGGSPGVWTSCLLFFQGALLLGYVYARFIARRFDSRVGALVHVALCTLSLIVLPIEPSASWKPVDASDPTFQILGLLAQTVGLPFLVLSATAPLVQVWAAGSGAGVLSYRLYAWSNAGSLLALLLYPLWLEEHLGRQAQVEFWSAAYLLFVALVLICGVRVYRSAAPKELEKVPWSPLPRLHEWLLWMALPAVTSGLLLATNHVISQDISVTPLLWVAPLALYLVSYIVVFSHPKAYSRALAIPVFLGALFAAIWMFRQEHDIKMSTQFVLCNAVLFGVCWVLHGELARAKPNPRYLTTYYLASALGSVLGAFFVAIIAPLVFPVVVEHQLFMVFACVLIGVLLWTQEGSPMARGRRIWAWCLFTIGGMASCFFFMGPIDRRIKNSVAVTRSFYGTLQLKEYGRGQRRILHLLDGRISHGFQFVDPRRRHQPTAYFVPRSGGGLALQYRPEGLARRVGILGLGTGTVAAYGEPGDVFRFYEINPDVTRFAKNNFTFLRDSKAELQIVEADARLALEREQPNHFDLLILDAFTGDAISRHLLTREAMALYLSHLRPGGALAINVSNMHISLIPVVLEHARHFRLQGVWIPNRWQSKVVGTYYSYWVLLVREDAPADPDIPQLLDWQPVVDAAGKPPGDGVTRVLWTDDHAPILPLLK